MWNQISYWSRVRTRRPRRYRRLLETVHARRPRTIVEIGTHKGRNAVEMIETASLFAAPRDIHYFGFDLFEMLTEEDLVKEFSLRPPSRAEVQRKLEQTGANIHLFQGYSRDTLKRLQQEPAAANGIDFVFLDGGHSHETIESDWRDIQPVLKRDSVVVFDDYYPGTEPEVQQVGCRKLIESLDRSIFEVTILAAEDHFRKDWGVLRVQMVSVRQKAGGVASSRPAV